MAEINIKVSEENDNLENKRPPWWFKLHKEMLVNLNDPDYPQETDKYESNIHNSLAQKKSKILNGITLNLAFIFGLPRPELSNLIYIIHDSGILYPIGQYFVIREINGFNCQFIKMDTNFKSISDIQVISLPKNDFILTYSEESKVIGELKNTPFKKKSYSISLGRGKKLFNDQKYESIKRSSKDPIIQNNVARTVIFQAIPKSKIVLEHIFDQPNRIIQTYINVGGYCLTLCRNEFWEDAIWVWNYKMHCKIMTIKPSQSIEKFLPNAQNYWDLICCGKQYLRIIQIKYTNKIYSESKNSLVNMSIEKKNHFIDMGFRPDSLLLIVISKSCNIYIFHNLILAYEIESLSIDGNPPEIGLKPNFKNKDEIGKILYDEDNEISMYEDRLINKSVKQHLNFCNSLELQIVKQLNENNKHFKCLTVGKKRFYIGWKGGLISCYEISENGPPVLSRTEQFDSHIRSIKEIKLSKDEATLGILGTFPGKIMERQMTPNYKKKDYTKQKQIKHNNIEKKLYSINWRSDIFSLQSVMFETNRANEGILRIYNKGTHSDNIEKIITSKSLSLIFTLGSNMSLKCWSFHDKWESEKNFLFEEQPNAITFHPSGLYMVITFQTCAQFYIFSEESLYLANIIPFKDCKCCCFNYLGNLLAISDFSTIYIVDSIYMKTLFSLEKHDSKINSLKWSENAGLLASCDQSNNIRVWDLKFINIKEKNVAEPISQIDKFSHTFLNIEVDNYLKLILALASNNKIYIFEFNSKGVPLLEINCDQMKMTTMILSISHKSIFVGNDSGSIRIFNWPIISPNPSFYDIYIDFSEISDLCLSPSGYYLFASTIHSNLFAMKIGYSEECRNKSWNIRNNNWERNSKTRERNNLPGHSMLDSLGLYKKEKVLSIMKKKLNVEQEREKKMREKIENSTKLNNKFHKIEKRQQEINDQEFQKKRENYESTLKLSFKKIQQQKEDINGIIENNKKYKEDRINKFEFKMNNIAVSCGEQEDDLEKLKRMCKKELDGIIIEHNKAIGNIREKYEKDLYEMKKQISQMYNKYGQSNKYYEKIFNANDEEYDNEILRNDLKTYKELNRINRNINKVGKEWEAFSTQTNKFINVFENLQNQKSKLPLREKTPQLIKDQEVIFEFSLNNTLNQLLLGDKYSLKDNFDERLINLSHNPKRSQGNTDKINTHLIEQEKLFNEELKQKLIRYDEAYQQSLKQISECDAYISDRNAMQVKLNQSKSNSQSCALLLQKENKKAMKQAEPLKQKLTEIKEKLERAYIELGDAAKFNDLNGKKIERKYKHFQEIQREIIQAQKDLDLINEALNCYSQGLKTIINSDHFEEQIPFGVADFIRETEWKYNYNKVEEKIIMPKVIANKREDDLLLSTEKKLVNQMQLAHSRIKQAEINHFMNRVVKKQVDLNLMVQNNALTDEYNRLLYTKQSLQNNQSLLEKKILDILVSLKEKNKIDQRLIFSLRNELLQSRNNNIFPKTKSKLFSKTGKNEPEIQKIRSSSNLKIGTNPARKKELIDVLLNKWKLSPNSNYAPHGKSDIANQQSEKKESTKRRNLPQDPRVMQLLMDKRKAKSVLKLFPAIKEEQIEQTMENKQY